MDFVQAVFRQVGSSTFYATWGESAVDARMTESLVFKTLGRVGRFVGFDLD